MQGAAFALLANVAIASLFAGSFAILAAINRRHRSTLWFTASYAAGVLTPLSEFLLPRSAWPAVFMITSFASLSAALLLMTAALAAFYRRSPPWALLGGIFVASLAARFAVWNVPRDTMLFGYGYQTPFAVAALISAWTVLRASPRRALEISLAILFLILAAHFLAKPPLAVLVGAGRTALDYSTSLYALLSQAGTGVLLIAIGLITLLIAVQTALADAVLASETDPLSGLSNRRGFDLRATNLLATTRRSGRPSAVMLIDIDHFKTINDTHGHAAGDGVIASLAGLLTRIVPEPGVIGRVGGEEFAILLSGATVPMARLIAESIRSALRSCDPSLPSYTVSIGVSGVAPEEAMAKAMRRADKALYDAKAAGRDRVCVIDDALPRSQAA